VEPLELLHPERDPSLGEAPQEEIRGPVLRRVGRDARIFEAEHPKGDLSIETGTGGKGHRNLPATIAIPPARSGVGSKFE
jgi:hypothetical protein